MNIISLIQKLISIWQVLTKSGELLRASKQLRFFLSREGGEITGCTCQPSNAKTHFSLPSVSREPSDHLLLRTHLGASTCTAASSAHVGYVGPFVRGWVILLDGTKALTGRSIVTPHGIELTWKRHTLASALRLRLIYVTVTPDSPW